MAECMVSGSFASNQYTKYCHLLAIIPVVLLLKMG